MKITCSYCLAAMGEKEPREDTRHSHSICPPCYTKHTRMWAGEDMAEDLADSDVPVAIVESDMRIIAVNRALEDVAGARSDEMQGRRAGEVLGCENSHGPGGCGTSPECANCPVRGAVNSAYAGRATSHVPGFVDQAAGRLEITLSARWVDELVQLSIDEVRGKVPLLGKVVAA